MAVTQLNGGRGEAERVFPSSSSSSSELAILFNCSLFMSLLSVCPLALPFLRLSRAKWREFVGMEAEKAPGSMQQQQMAFSDTLDDAAQSVEMELVGALPLPFYRCVSCFSFPFL